MEPNLEVWQEEASKNCGITTEFLDNLITAYQLKYTQYEEQKAVATHLYKEAEELEGKIVEALEAAGKSKYVVEGIGTVYFINKLVVPTPKTIEQKRLLFDYIKNKHGDIFFMDKVSVNHATLQKLYNEDFKEHLEHAEKQGTTPETFHIPGLDAPTNMRSLGMRKEKA